MSTLTAALIAIGLPAVGLPLLALGLCRAAGMASRAEEARGLRVWDESAQRWLTLPYGTKPGPGQLTKSEVAARDRCQLLIGELNADPYDPKWDAGCERLLDAIRDHRTNTSEGDL